MLGNRQFAIHRNAVTLIEEMNGSDCVDDYCRRHDLPILECPYCGPYPSYAGSCLSCASLLPEAEIIKSESQSSRDEGR
jgi:hypothetical protein